MGEAYIRNEKVTRAALICQFVEKSIHSSEPTTLFRGQLHFTLPKYFKFQSKKPLAIQRFLLIAADVNEIFVVKPCWIRYDSLLFCMIAMMNDVCSNFPSRFYPNKVSSYLKLVTGKQFDIEF